MKYTSKDFEFSIDGKSIQSAKRDLVISDECADSNFKYCHGKRVDQNMFIEFKSNEDAEGAISLLKGDDEINFNGIDYIIVSATAQLRTVALGLQLNRGNDA